MSIFSRYRDVCGVQWPRSIQRERNCEKIFELYSESVAISQDLKRRRQIENFS